MKQLRIFAFVVILLELHSSAMLSSVVESSLSGSESPLLKKIPRSGTDSESDEATGGPPYLRHRYDDSNESSETELESEERLRFRREEVKPQANGNKVIVADWGTYEEQAPVVVQNGTRSDDESSPYSAEYRSNESTDDSGEFNDEDSSSYEDYEAGRFEGRQLYDDEKEQEQPDDYYRQKYYLTTVKPTTYQQAENQQWKGVSNRPNYAIRNGQQRPQHREPQPTEEPNQVIGFIQKAKTFYDIFRAMNDAWATLQDRYRKNGQGIFPPELGSPEEADVPKATKSKTNQLPPNSNKQTKQSKTTKPPADADDDSKEENTNQEDENRARRSSANKHNNTSLFEADSSSTTIDDSQSSESDLQSTSDSDSESSFKSESDSSSDTAVAEGRYIKGDPLKGYYDFVITEGSYKFWAAFQVGTALLIIYSTFAAIYYSKVNPLVSDYDYIDYLGGGRSLSDDSDFVDTDAPAAATVPASSDATQSTSRGRQPPDGSSAGWFSWLPHAGYTLRFILESIDKGYNEE